MSMKPKAREKRRSLTDDVVAAISEQIQGGRFPPGSKLPTELAIMGQQQVSRTVVREAISRLQAAGLVETRHGIGTFIKDSSSAKAVKIAAASVFTLLDTLAILELRISLETEAAALAATRRSQEDVQALRASLDDFKGHIGQAKGNAISADLAFHLRIASATGNKYFQDILGQLGKRLIPRARLDTTRIDRDDHGAYLQRVNREHEDIWAAIERRDPEAARAAMRTHLTNSRERLRKAYESMTDESTAPSRP